jgi:hypothetical protein
MIAHSITAPHRFDVSVSKSPGPGATATVFEAAPVGAKNAINIVNSWKIVARPASHDRGVLVVGAGRYHGVHALASTVAPDRGPRPKVDAVGNAGGDENGQ